ncbi:hypothetical protein F5Y09DRAFT_346923 [Xylaria sp. FL1042]|nr:hypothetical protein F5Y09DRAFT_346923 [Xylaria sp. FL1042]
MPTIQNDLPHTIQQWYELGEQSSLKSQSIYTAGFTLKSASKIELKQFFLLRAIYPPATPACYLIKRHWFKENGLEYASKVLGENTAWKRYIQSILSYASRNATESKPYDFAVCGHFSMVHYYQINPSRSTNQEQTPSEKITPYTPVNMRTRSGRRAARELEPQTPTRAPEGKSIQDYMDVVDENLDNLSLNPQTPEPIIANQASTRVPELLTPTSPISIEEAKHLWSSTDDEQFISHALIFLLNTLSMCCKDVTGGRRESDSRSQVLRSQFKS